MTFFRSDLFYQLIALLVSFILVHAIYTAAVRPNAEAHLAQQTFLQQQAEQNDSAFVSERSIWVVLKDYEQEACFILMLWAMAIMAMKARRTLSEQRLLGYQLLDIPEGTRVIPEDAHRLSRTLEALPSEEQEFLLPRAISAALQRLAAQGSLQDIAGAIRDTCDAESQHLDSELSMVRYIAWAIPSIGFIGTVRGIGEALANAHQAVAGDIAAVTASLGVAFNSTFIALLISIVIMFLSHQLTLQQERLVLRAQRYGDRYLLRHIHAH